MFDCVKAVEQPFMCSESRRADTVAVSPLIMLPGGLTDRRAMGVCVCVCSGGGLKTEREHVQNTPRLQLPSTRSASHLSGRLQYDCVISLFTI